MICEKTGLQAGQFSTWALLNKKNMFFGNGYNMLFSNVLLKDAKAFLKENMSGWQDMLPQNLSVYLSTCFIPSYETYQFHCYKFILQAFELSTDKKVDCPSSFQSGRCKVHGFQKKIHISNSHEHVYIDYWFWISALIYCSINCLVLVFGISKFTVC